MDYSDTATATIVDNDHLPAPVADLGSAVEGTTALSLLHVLANDTDADGDTLSVSQFATDAVGTNGANANGSNTVTTVLGGTVTMNANGTFTYTAPVRDHSTLGDDQDSFYYKATDGTNLSGWTLVRIDITDTVPSIAPINTILQNESGLVVAGVDLGLVLSADVSPTTVKLSLAHTETVSGKTYILTEADARMSSDAVDLLVRYNADGSIDAVKDDGSGTVIFSITPNVATGTYSINLIGPLDGADGTDFAFGSAYKGGNTSVIFVGETSDTPLYTDPDNNGSYTATDPAALVIRATGSTNGTASTINASNFSIGVGNGQDVSPGDRMVLEFTEASSWVGTKSGGNIQLAQAGASIAYESLVGLTFNVAQIETNEVVAFELRSGGATGSVVAAGTLTFSGPTLSGNSFEHVVVGDGADPVQGHFTLSFSDPIGSATFDTAVFTSGTYDYKIGSIEAITAEQGFDQVIDVIATATDGDLTLSDPVGFSVTFDGTGAIEGTAGNEVLAGGVGSDAFKWNFGDTGADVIKDFSVAPLASGGDVLDLKDLLLNEHDGTGINTSNLTQYLHFTEVAGKVVLSLDHDGGATFVADQTIQLDNFSSVSAFATALGAASASDADIISKMIATGHLNTDV